MTYTLVRPWVGTSQWVTQKVIRCHPLKFDSGCFGTAISFRIKRRFVEYPFLKFWWNCHESLSFLWLRIPFTNTPNHPNNHQKNSPNQPAHQIKPTNSERMSHSNYQINQVTKNQSRLNQPTNQPTNVPKIHPSQPTNQPASLSIASRSSRMPTPLGGVQGNRFNGR